MILAKFKEAQQKHKNFHNFLNRTSNLLLRYGIVRSTKIKFNNVTSCRFQKSVLFVDSNNKKLTIINSMQNLSVCQPFATSLHLAHVSGVERRFVIDIFFKKGTIFNETLTQPSNVKFSKVVLSFSRILFAWIYTKVKYFGIATWNFSSLSSCSQGPEQIHVSKFYKDAKNGKFYSYLKEDVQTLYDTFRQGAYESNNGNALGEHQLMEMLKWKVELSLKVGANH